MPTAKLSLNEEVQFDELVKKSITSRYTGELERRDCEDGSVVFLPLDEPDVRELLVELWGEKLTLDEIDNMEHELVADGTPDYADWPHAWCEEELEDAETEQARERDREENAREARMRAIERIEEGTGDGHETQKSEDDSPL